MPAGILQRQTGRDGGRTTVDALTAWAAPV
jgi:hypothetical protein